MNTNIMCLRPLYMFNSFGAGSVFRRQKLTSKGGPRAARDTIVECWNVTTITARGFKLFGNSKDLMPVNEINNFLKL